MKPPTQEQLSHLMSVNIRGIVLTLLVVVVSVGSILSIYGSMPASLLKIPLVIAVCILCFRGLNIIKNWVNAEMKEYRAYQKWLATKK